MKRRTVTFIGLAMVALLLASMTDVIVPSRRVAASALFLSVHYFFSCKRDLDENLEKSRRPLPQYLH